MCMSGTSNWKTVLYNVVVQAEQQGPASLPFLARAPKAATQRGSSSGGPGKQQKKSTKSLVGLLTTVDFFCHMPMPELLLPLRPATQKSNSDRN